MSKLLLCAGDWRPEGFRTLDTDPQFSPDYCMKLPCQIPDAPYSEIQLIHGIEHFYLWDAYRVLSDCYRALEPGGLLVLEQPNLEVAAKVLLGLMDSPTENEEQSSLWAIYGNPVGCSPLMAHKSGWTPLIMEETLHRVGQWRSIELKLAQYHVPRRDFRMEAVKV